MVLCWDKLQEYSTCAEREEEEFNLLTFWEQLNEVKLERNHVDAALRDQSFSCTHRTNSFVNFKKNNALVFML